MELNISVFGETSDKEKVYLYTIKNEEVEVEILSYGGIIKSLKTADKNNKYENIVLGYDNFEPYKENPNFYSCITGRIAGRTKNGVLKIDGIEYKLEKNSGENNLHGGKKGLNTKNWDGEAKIVDDRGILTLEYKSPHLEAGFPAEVEFKVVYTLEKNILSIEYFAKADRKTYLNLTNHAYFNLSGEQKETVLDNYLSIYAEKFARVNDKTLPEEYINDESFIKLNKKQQIKDIFNSKHEQLKIVGNGIDHPFELSKKSEYDIFLEDERSGRTLGVKSNQPVCVIYTGNFLENKYTGICFEMQDYPDIFNSRPEKAKIYDLNNLYYNKTSFIFNS